MMRDDDDEEDVGADAAGGTKNEGEPKASYLIKSASSELEALMGGAAGVLLLPPEAR